LIRGKTIYIAQNWDDTGVRAQLKTLALELSKRNEVVFLNARKTGKKKTLINERLVLYEWPGKRPTGFKDFLFAFDLMRRGKPDIIITNFAANNIMLLAAWLLKVKVRIAFFHTMVDQYIADNGRLSVKQRINIFRKGIVFKTATHMLPCSSAAQKDLVKYYGVKKNKTFVFHNAVYEQVEKNHASEPVVGFLGRLDRSKGVDILIKAFAALTQKIPGARLMIAGKGKEYSRLKDLAMALKVERSVEFVGIIGYNKIFDFLRRLNFLVVPSRMDNLPTVVLEAFSCSTPVIGSDAGGIPDMIIPGHNGLLFENGNADDLAKKMLSLLQNSAERGRITGNMQNVFDEKFNMKGFVARFEDFMEKHTDLQ
jgi:glycosyltransferase involved in cell wall biosynthesis